MSLPITLPVLTYSAEQAREAEEAQRMGIPIEDSVEGSEVTNMRLYIIENVSEYTAEGDGMYSLVSSGGQVYMVDMPVKEIIKLIENDTRQH